MSDARGTPTFSSHLCRALGSWNGDRVQCWQTRPTVSHGASCGTSESCINIQLAQGAAMTDPTNLIDRSISDLQQLAAEFATELEKSPARAGQELASSAPEGSTFQRSAFCFPKLAAVRRAGTGASRHGLWGVSRHAPRALITTSSYRAYDHPSCSEHHRAIARRWDCRATKPDRIQWLGSRAACLVTRTLIWFVLLENRDQRIAIHEPSATSSGLCSKSLRARKFAPCPRR